MWWLLVGCTTGPGPQAPSACPDGVVGVEGHVVARAPLRRDRRCHRDQKRAAHGDDPGIPVDPGGAGPASTPLHDARMAAWEEALVGPLLADARQGVRPWDDRGMGICLGSRACEAFLGSEVGELPAGEYIVRAELRVPELGAPGTWSVAYRSTCEIVTIDKDGSQKRRSESVSLDQVVGFSGPTEGWRIEPLQRIQSPSNGAAKCTWTLEARQPSGPRLWSGSWETPAAAAERSESGAARPTKRGSGS